MKNPNYAGIDYSLGKSNCDTLTGIRYGVISQNSVMPDALDDIMTQGKDMAWESALKEAIRDAKNEAQTAWDNLPETDDKPSEPEEVDEDSISDDLSMNWESSLSNYLYEEAGYKLTGCLDNDLFVLASPFFTYAQFCSPCVPGAGNLDSAYNPAENEPFEPANLGFPRVYCLGHDWFEEGKAPYKVYSVETGKEVLPE